MISITIDANDAYPLVDQIVDGIRRQIDERCLRPGTKLPSIRKFADAYGVSRFTVVEAYDRLVALGYLEARRGAGFCSGRDVRFIARPPPRSVRAAFPHTAPASGV
jgi:DNA-binding transcriptional MocR family regulator